MSTPPDPVSPEVDEALLAGTITATCTAIFERFGPEGRFLSPGDSGLTSTLYVIATLHFLGRLDPALARGAARTILGEQLPHGAFPNYPGDPNGDPWVTGLAAAVLRLAPDPSHEEAIARAERYIDLAGGKDLGRSRPVSAEHQSPLHGHGRSARSRRAAGRARRAAAPPRGRRERQAPRQRGAPVDGRGATVGDPAGAPGPRRPKVPLLAGVPGAKARAGGHGPVPEWRPRQLQRQCHADHDRGRGVPWGPSACRR